MASAAVRTECPADPSLPRKPSEAARGKRILCALDHSDGSAAALQFLLDRLVKPGDGDRVILFHAARAIDLSEPRGILLLALEFGYAVKMDGGRRWSGLKTGWNQRSALRKVTGGSSPSASQSLLF